MELFAVNSQTCNRDGLCAAVCPLGIIDWSPGAEPTPAVGAEGACIRCGHCVAVCPTDSLSHRDMAVESCPPVRPEWRLSPEQGEHFLRARRSIRVYRDKPVERDALAQLIDVARYAPSGINSQGARWLGLTTIRVPRRELGIHAAHMALSLARGEQPDPFKICLPVELVVRQTCGRIAG